MKDYTPARITLTMGGKWYQDEPMVTVHNQHGYMLMIGRDDTPSGALARAARYVRRNRGEPIETPRVVYTARDAADIRHRIYGDSYAAGVVVGVYGHPTHPAGKRATMARSVRRETAGRGNWLAVAVPKPSPYPAA